MMSESFWCLMTYLPVLAGQEDAADGATVFRDQQVYQLPAGFAPGRPPADAAATRRPAGTVAT